jgi:AbrB family looped-hinge helix DNA binding protein
LLCGDGYFSAPFDACLNRLLPSKPFYSIPPCGNNGVDFVERVKLDKKGRLTIPAEYKRKLGLGEEVTLILEEDHLIVCGTASAEEFKKVSRRLSEEIAKKRRKPIGFEKLFQ